MYICYITIYICYVSISVFDVYTILYQLNETPYIQIHYIILCRYVYNFILYLYVFLY